MLIIVWNWNEAFIHSSSSTEAIFPDQMTYPFGHNVEIHGQHSVTTMRDILRQLGPQTDLALSSVIAEEAIRTTTIV